MNIEPTRKEKISSFWNHCEVYQVSGAHLRTRECIIHLTPMPVCCFQRNAAEHQQRIQEYKRTIDKAKICGVLRSSIFIYICNIYIVRS